MDNEEYIRTRGEERRGSVFRPDTARVIKPRSGDDLSDVSYTEEDRAAYLAGVKGATQ